jgi:hypothetical protein
LHVTKPEMQGSLKQRERKDHSCKGTAGRQPTSQYTLETGYQCLQMLTKILLCPWNRYQVKWPLISKANSDMFRKSNSQHLFIFKCFYGYMMFSGCFGCDISIYDHGVPWFDSALHYSPTSPSLFLKWLLQVSTFHIYICIENTSTIFTPLCLLHLPTFRMQCSNIHVCYHF